MEVKLRSSNPAYLFGSLKQYRPVDCSTGRIAWRSLLRMASLLTLLSCCGWNIDVYSLHCTGIPKRKPRSLKEREMLGDVIVARNDKRVLHRLLAVRSVHRMYNYNKGGCGYRHHAREILYAIAWEVTTQSLQ